MAATALGRSTSTKPFTYYPMMPGNSTSRPAEKAALQADCMRAAFFDDASTHSCQVTTLDKFMLDHDITQINLLKVLHSPSANAHPMHMNVWRLSPGIQSSVNNHMHSGELVR